MSLLVDLVTHLVALDELLALGDGFLELWNGSLDKRFLVVGQFTETVVLLDTVLTESEFAAKVGSIGDVGLNISVLNDVLAALSGQAVVSESRGGESHREGSRASASLGLDDLSTGILDSGGQSLGGLFVEAHRGRGLGDDWDDGDTGVATDDWYVLVSDVVTGLLGDEGLGSHDVKGGYTEDLVFVVATDLLVNLSGNWDGGVDWVRNDANPSLWAVLGTGLSQRSDDIGVGVEKIISGHAWLSWHTSWDDNQVAVLQAIGNLVVSLITGTVGWSIAMAQIGGDTWGGGNIKKSELVDIWVGLEEEAEWLSNTTGGTENGHVSGGSAGLGEGSAEHFFIAARERKRGASFCKFDLRL